MAKHIDPLQMRPRGADREKAGAIVANFQVIAFLPSQDRPIPARWPLSIKRN
jgi:hypothetical protein